MTVLEKIKSKEAKIGIVGLGYVGLPLALAFCSKKFRVLGFDISEKLSKKSKLDVRTLKISKMRILELGVIKGCWRQPLTSRLGEVDVIIICVPTPLSKHREPDLGPILRTGQAIVPYLRKDQLHLWSQAPIQARRIRTWQGEPEKSGLKKDEDFFLAYSPEREDPGNETFSTSTIPKIVGADSGRKPSRWLQLFMRGLFPRLCLSPHRELRSNQADGKHIPFSQYRAGERAESYF